MSSTVSFYVIPPLPFLNMCPFNSSNIIFNDYYLLNNNNRYCLTNNVNTSCCKNMSVFDYNSQLLSCLQYCDVMPAGLLTCQNSCYNKLEPSLFGFNPQFNEKINAANFSPNHL